MTVVQDRVDSSQAQLDEALHRFADAFSWLRTATVVRTLVSAKLRTVAMATPKRERKARARIREAPRSSVPILVLNNRITG